MKRAPNGEETYYAGSFVYKGSNLEYILHSEGKYRVSDEDGGYQYHLTDHLGNVRMVVKGDATKKILDQTHYYPFGMSMNMALNASGQKNLYKYNGKELQEDKIGNGELDWYDYGARFYDAALGRFHTVDPAIENNHHDYSPYAYVYNNPLRFIDPFGLDSAEAAAVTQTAENAVNWVEENYGSTSAQCNRGVNYAFEELTGNDELSGKTANEMVDEMEGSDDFEEVDRDNVQTEADDGAIIIAGKKESSSGHVALSVPGDEVSSGNWGGNAPVGMDTGANKRWSKNGMNFS